MFYLEFEMHVIHMYHVKISIIYILHMVCCGFELLKADNVLPFFFNSLLSYYYFDLSCIFSSSISIKKNAINSTMADADVNRDQLQQTRLNYFIIFSNCTTLYSY